MTSPSRHQMSVLMAYAPAGLYVLIVAVFTAMSPAFLSLDNVRNILVQSSSVAVMAVGITFVLLTAGIDLSVGSIMILAGSIGGTLVVAAHWPVPAALGAMVVAGLAMGAVNGVCITRLGMAPFIVTLSTLFIARGIGLWITETRAINLPDTFRQLATARLAGVPSPVLILLAVVVGAEVALRRTAFGRQLYAVGNDAAAARKAGIEVDRILRRVYAVSGALAAVGAIIALAQLSAVSPNLGEGRELEAIAAAVLGGSSLFGGRGTALGSVLGAVLIETVRNGLNVVDADPYLYPMISAAIIFLAVLLDAWRQQRLAELRRLKIRPPAARAA